MGKFAKFWRLSRADKRVIGLAMGGLPVTMIGLRSRGLRRWYGWLSNRPVSPSPPSNPHRRAKEIAHLIKLVCQQGPLRPNCLDRSLLLWWVLRRRGMVADLRIGVRRGEADGLEAHAWLEFGGQVLNDRPDVATQYAPFNEPIVPAQVVWR